MTTHANENSLHFSAPRRHVLRDVALVASLLVVLGAFVAQISSAPSASAQTSADARA